MTYTNLGFMADVASVCEVCEGRRFTDEVLEYRLRDRNIVDVLAMSVEEAQAFFTERPVKVMLDRLADVGLGYVSLGQELDTLSGGERQRLKLAIEMSGSTEVYVLDEPTTGLHMQDVDNLIGLLDRLVDVGADGDRHRAQPRRRRPRGLGDRPGTGRGPRRRPGDLRGTARGARARRGVADRAAPPAAPGGRPGRLTTRRETRISGRAASPRRGHPPASGPR